MSVSNPRSHALDTLRALAILLVMPFHIAYSLPLFMQPVARFGWMGVDLFFVLSGYLIGAQLLRPAAAGRPVALGTFYARRAWRILPAYLVVVAIYLFVPSWREDPNIAHAWQFLTFTLNLNIDYAQTRAFSHAWSLCVEEHFYLVLPLLVITLMRRPSLRVTAAVAAVVLIGGMVLRGIALDYLRTLDPNGDEFSLFYLEHIYYPTWTRLDGLLLGVLLAATQIFRPQWWNALLRRTHLLLSASIGLTLISLAMFSRRYDTAEGITGVGSVIGFPLLALALACLLVSMQSPRSPLSARIPGTRPLATLAFSLYLSHKMMFHLVQRTFPNICENHRGAALGLYAVAALSAAAVLYFVVERPFLLLRDRRRSAVSEALTNPAI